MDEFKTYYVELTAEELDIVKTMRAEKELRKKAESLTTRLNELISAINVAGLKLTDREYNYYTEANFNGRDEIVLK